MALDARVRYTKLMIQNSFIELIKEKPFSKITLKEVCALAGINHSTFYRHYKDIFDWKEQFEASCRERMVQILESSSMTNIHDVLSIQLKQFQENKELYTMMASDNFESCILQQLCAIAIDKTETRLKEVLLADPQGQEKWNCYYTVYGTEGVIRCWVNDGMVQPPEEVIDYIAAHIFANFGG